MSLEGLYSNLYERVRVELCDVVYGVRCLLSMYLPC